MPVLEEKLGKLQKIEKGIFSSKIVQNTSDELVDIFDDNGKTILEELELGEEYITLASKLMSKDISSILSVILVIKTKEGSDGFKQDIKKGKNSVIFSILKETILETGLLYIGFTQEMIDTYLGDETILDKPINIKSLLKLVDMKENGTLKAFQKLGLIEFDTIDKISQISNLMLKDINNKLDRIIFFRDEYGMSISCKNILDCDTYFEEGMNKSEIEDKLYSNDFPDSIKKLMSKFSLLRHLGLEIEFEDIHSLYINGDNKRFRELKKGVDNALEIEGKLKKLRKFGFKVNGGDLTLFNSSFFGDQIDHLISLLPKLKKLVSYKEKEFPKIELSLDEISRVAELSKEILDELIEKKKKFALFFHIINKQTIGLKDIVELGFMATNENSLKNYIKLQKAGIIIPNSQLKKTEDILNVFSDCIFDKVCRLSNMGIGIDVFDIQDIVMVNDEDIESIFENEDNIRALLGTDKIIEDSDDSSSKGLFSSTNNKLKGLAINSDGVPNIEWLAKACSLSIFPEFIKRYESLKLGQFYLNIERMSKLLEYYDETPKEFFSMLEKLRDSDAANQIKEDFINIITDTSKPWYKLPEATIDEYFIAKQIINNKDNILDSIVFLEDLGYDTSKNSGTYFACLRRLKDDNAWHHYEYAEYLYDTADIDDNGITDDNWVSLLGLYTVSDMDEGMHLELKENLDKIIPQNDIDNKNIFLEKMKGILEKILDKGIEGLPREEEMIIDILHTNGCGNLSYIEGIGNFLYKLIEVFRSEKVINKTKIKSKLKEGIQSILGVFTKKRWEQADIVDFFNIGTDILESAPSLYTTYLDLFQKLSPKQLKQFYKDMYPYYHIELILHQEIDRDGKFSYNSRDLVSFRKNIKKLIVDLEKSKNPTNILEKEQKRIQNGIQEQFQVRFGIKKIPENITGDHMQSIKNHTLYLGNIHDSDETKEALIGFFLALKLNGVWNDFREGKDISLRDYMVEDNINILESYMKDRKENSINLNTKDIPENFDKLLQEDVVLQSVGDIEDIDVRLLSIQGNINELLDEDIYSGKDKIILRLLKIFGKSVGKALAMKFRELSEKGVLGTEDEMILDILSKELNIDDWNLETVQGLQDILKSISPITNFVQKIMKIGLDGQVRNLEKIKIPSREVIMIFSKLGEEFTTNSGIRSISNDVQYLRMIVAKGDYKLDDDEKIIINDYLDKTEEHILNLESIKDNIEKLFDNLHQQLRNTSNNILKDRLDALKEIIYQSIGEKKIIITKMTTDLDTVITNIRACLSCKKKECNNDTNLSFGDNNRFFLTSYSGSLERSFSDQLVTLLETNKGPMFIMDLMYGERVPDVFLAHILSVYKKLKSLKTNDISIFIPFSAMRGCHLTEENIIKHLKENLGKGEYSIVKEKHVNISVGDCSSGDSYHEFSESNYRGTGEREVSGFVLSII